MDGVHDMGGRDGFGAVEQEPKEPVFHARWEARVLAITRAMGATGAWNKDVSRFARETLPPHIYLSSSYYERWLLGIEKLLLERGLVDEEELASGRSSGPRSSCRKARSPKRTCLAF